MPKYDVVGVVTGSKYLGVYEAKTEEEAVNMALSGDNCYVSICHQCSEHAEDCEIHEAIASERDSSSG